MYESYDPSEFLIISTITENAADVTPAQADLELWATEYDLSTPVIADDGAAIAQLFQDVDGVPTVSLLGPGPTVLIRDGEPTEEDIDAAIAGDLGHFGL